jgi:hypothetical protein
MAGSAVRLSLSFFFLCIFFPFITSSRRLTSQVLFPSADVVQGHMATANCLNLGGAKIEKIPDVCKVISKSLFMDV